MNLRKIFISARDRVKVSARVGVRVTVKDRDWHHSHFRSNLSLGKYAQITFII